MINWLILQIQSQVFKEIKDEGNQLSVNTRKNHVNKITSRAIWEGPKNDLWGEKQLLWGKNEVMVKRLEVKYNKFTFSAEKLKNSIKKIVEGIDKKLAAICNKRDRESTIACFGYLFFFCRIDIFTSTHLSFEAIWIPSFLKKQKTSTFAESLLSAKRTILASSFQINFHLLPRKPN